MMMDVYQKVKAYYERGLWDETRLGNMVVRDIITEQQYIAIVGSDVEYGGVKGDLMEGATVTEDGAAGLVPPPPKGSGKRYLRSDGIWTSADGGDADTVDGCHASRANTPDTVVVRGSDGSVQLGRIISDAPDDENTAVGQVIVTDGSDGLYRKVNIQTLKEGMGISLFNSVMAYGASKTGYIRFLDIDSANSAKPFVIDIGMRGGSMARIRLVLKNDKVLAFQTTPVIASSDTGGWIDPATLYLARTGTDLFSLYTRLSQGYGAAFISISNGSGAFKDGLVSSLPIGYMTPTEVAYIP